MNCKNCNSPDVIKNGIHRKGTLIRQMYRCRTCNTFIYERLSHDPVRREVTYSPPKVAPEENSFSWNNYNDAQMQEKLLFLDILEDLCSRLPEAENGNVGRPKASTREIAFCMVSKLYERLSSRRVSSDLIIAMQRGHITKVPHFNTVLKYFNEPAMAPMLTDLIGLSSLPLRDFESTFAVDASGLSSAFYSRWLDERIKPAREHQWVKIHVICGVKSNIITAIEVTDGHSHDSPHFPKLIRETAKHFRMKEVLADKGYSGRNNMQAAFEVGAVPYIPFKVNATGKADGSMAWSKMFHYFKLHQKEFMTRYHLRSNIESTFSALKRKFSHKLLSKNEAAQVNEALAMLLCHNICVLVREAFENGIIAEFEQSAHLFPSLHINRGPQAKDG
jgi:transposase